MESYERIDRLEDKVSDLGSDLESSECRVTDLSSALEDACEALDALCASIDQTVTLARRAL